MRAKIFAATLALPALTLVTALPARAADFDWKKFQGKTVTFLANNNPMSAALLTHKADFEKLTGITLKVDGYQEQQMRQRLVTVMNAHSDEVDVFMTLPSREGEQFAAAGWYADLTAMAKSESLATMIIAGLSQALLKAATFGGKLTSMPMNIEGPVLYYRTDIFKKCGVDEAQDHLAMSRPRRKKIKACDGSDHAVRFARPEAGVRLYVQQHAAQYRAAATWWTASPHLCSAKGQAGARDL